MKVILLRPFILARTNGGDISLIEIFKLFQDWNWETRIEILLPASERAYWKQLLRHYGIEASESSYTVDGLTCQVQFLEGIDPHQLESQPAYETFYLEKIREFDADYAFVHYTDFFASSAALKWNPEKTWVRVTDNEFPRLGRLSQFPSLIEAYSKIKNFLVASEFMKTKLTTEFPNAEAFVLHNPIADLKQSPPLGFEPKYWLFVNPIPEKGLNFIVDLSRALPNEKFLILGNWARDPLPSAKLFGPNVKVEGWRPELRSIWKESIGLLYPSVWEEAFGRLPLEAMAHGVPVLASDRGALSSTVGNGGFSLPLDIPQWIDAMNQVRSKPEVFRKKGFERVKEYLSRADQSHRSFQELLETSVRVQRA